MEKEQVDNLIAALDRLGMDVDGTGGSPGTTEMIAINLGEIAKAICYLADEISGVLKKDKG